MRFSTPLRIVSMFALTFALAAVAGDQRGTPEDAQALVARAIAHYDQAGMQKAFADFQDPDGGFVDRDLYVFVYGPERTIVAHGSDPSQVGRAADSVRDVDGVPFGTQFMDESTVQGGWFNYKWRDPNSGEVLPKKSWLVRHDGHVFGVGVYTP